MTLGEFCDFVAWNTFNISIEIVFIWLRFQVQMIFQTPKSTKDSRNFCQQNFYPKNETSKVLSDQVWQPHDGNSFIKHVPLVIIKLPKFRFCAKTTLLKSCKNVEWDILKERTKLVGFMLNCTSYKFRRKHRKQLFTVENLDGVIENDQDASQKFFSSCESKFPSSLPSAWRFTLDSNICSKTKNMKQKKDFH